MASQEHHKRSHMTHGLFLLLWYGFCRTSLALLLTCFQNGSGPPFQNGPPFSSQKIHQDTAIARVKGLYNPLLWNPYWMLLCQTVREVHKDRATAEVRKLLWTFVRMLHWGQAWGAQGQISPREQSNRTHTLCVGWESGTLGKLLIKVTSVWSQAGKISLATGSGKKASL